MRVTIIVTIPSWFKLPVPGECEVCYCEGRGVQRHHAHSDHDDVDRKLAEYRILLGIQDAAEYFLVSRYSIYACLNRQRVEFPA